MQGGYSSYGTKLYFMIYLFHQINMNTRDRATADYVTPSLKGWGVFSNQQQKLHNTVGTWVTQPATLQTTEPNTQDADSSDERAGGTDNNTNTRWHHGRARLMTAALEYPFVVMRSMLTVLSRLVCVGWSLHATVV